MSFVHLLFSQAAFIQTSYGPEPAIGVSETLGRLMHSLSNGNPLYVKLSMDVLQTETPFFRKTPDGLGVALDVAKECTVRGCALVRARARVRSSGRLHTVYWWCTHACAYLHLVHVCLLPVCVVRAFLRACVRAYVTI